MDPCSMLDSKILHEACLKISLDNETFPDYSNFMKYVQILSFKEIPSVKSLVLYLSPASFIEYGKFSDITRKHLKEKLVEFENIVVSGAKHENSDFIQTPLKPQDIDDDLINEDELIRSEDLIKPNTELKKDCGTGTVKKACKNCTCGLAETIANSDTIIQTKTKEQASSCGSCYLGDAFRCASCPYRGLPAFKPGEVVSIPTDFIADDLDAL